jgi:uncharacterized protein involved in exopolysaccharide biosynthesis
MSLTIASAYLENGKASVELERINITIQQLSQIVQAMEHKRDNLRAEVASLRSERDEYRKALAAIAMAEVTPEELERRACEPSKPYAEVLARLEQLKKASA